MENRNALLYELIENKKFIELRQILIEMNEVDISEFFENLEIEKMVAIFRMLPKEISSEVFSFLESDTQEHIINSVTDIELSEIIEDLFVDDAVDLMEELPAYVVKRVLKNANSETRDIINQFLLYKENSAGSIMTAEFIDLRKDMTVDAAFEKVRKLARNMETTPPIAITPPNLSGTARKMA